MFFAIKGERFDGHDFLNEVAAKGVTAVVVEQKKVPAPLPGRGGKKSTKPRWSDRLENRWDRRNDQ